MDAPIGSDFTRDTFTHQGRTHDVFRSGDGPAVIVVHEVPNLHPGVVDFARRLRDHGYTVYLPSLFGTPGAPATGKAALKTVAHVCVSREFTLLTDRTSRVNSWLRALARHAYEQCGGAGVGAVGMCLTGGFALAMAVEPAVLAPVVAEPALPAPIGRKKAALGLDPSDLATVRNRDGLCVLGLRFSHDKGSPAERFQTLRRVFGDRFEAIEIDSGPGNPHGIAQRAHSVLTVDLVEQPNHPTYAARERVIGFLDEQLHPGDRDTQRSS